MSIDVIQHIAEGSEPWSLVPVIKLWFHSQPNIWSSYQVAHRLCRTAFLVSIKWGEKWVSLMRVFWRGNATKQVKPLVPCLDTQSRHSSHISCCYCFTGLYLVVSLKWRKIKVCETFRLLMFYACKARLHWYLTLSLILWIFMILFSHNLQHRFLAEGFPMC